MRINKILFSTISLCAILNAGNILDDLSGQINTQVDNTVNGAIDSAINGGAMTLINIAQGFGNGFDLGFISGALNTQCDISRSVEVPSVCDFLNFPDFNLNFNKNFNVAGCNQGIGGSVDSDRLKNMLENLCEQNIEDARRGFTLQTIDKIFTAKRDDYSIFSEIDEVIEDGKSIFFVNTEQPNGFKINEIFSKDGLLGHNTISNGGDNIPSDLRTSYATDDVITYEAYERTSRIVEKDGNGDVNLTIEPYAPPTYLDYIAQVQAEVKNIRASKADMKALEDKFRAEITTLKASENVSTLSGATSIAMQQEYGLKYAKVLKKMMTLEVSDDSDGHNELAKALRALANYEWKNFEYQEEVFKRENPIIVQPSMQKVDLQQPKNRQKYADRIFMQLLGESRRKAELEFSIEKNKKIIIDLAKRIFYEEMTYNPAIAQKELQELMAGVN